MNATNETTQTTEPACGTTENRDAAAGSGLYQYCATTCECGDEGETQAVIDPAPEPESCCGPVCCTA